MVSAAGKPGRKAKIRDLKFKGENMARKIIVKTGGMSCTGCERTIANALSRVNGILEAKADYTTEKTTVKYDEGKIGLKEIKDATENAGYDFGGEVDG